MLAEEAYWIKAFLESQPDEVIFPMINIGSSTGHFRAVIQPHIDQEIFGPLRTRAGEVTHVDIKHAPGVDLVGDLTDARFQTCLRFRVKPRCLLVSNLLEHVVRPERVARLLVGLVDPGGLIIVTGPHSYPYHPDPIDTRFRPTVPEVHALFPQTSVVASEVIRSQQWRPWSSSGDATQALPYFARLVVPFVRPRSWRRQLSTAPYIFRRVSAYALALRVDGEFVPPCSVASKALRH